MNVASLVLGIVGAVPASLSLGWQAANYVLTGGRIKVVLRVGGRSHGGMITMPTERFTEESPKLLASQGFPQPIVAVTVANVGRQPVTVARWGLVSGLGTSLYQPPTQSDRRSRIGWRWASRQLGQWTRPP